MIVLRETAASKIMNLALGSRSIIIKERCVAEQGAKVCGVATAKYARRRQVFFSFKGDSTRHERWFSIYKSRTVDERRTRKFGRFGMRPYHDLEPPLPRKVKLYPEISTTT